MFVFNKEIFFNLYNEGSMVRFINTSNNRTISRRFTKNEGFVKFFKKLNQNINYLNSYIEKYPNENKINNFYLDFDGESSQVKKDVIKVVNLLRDKNIGYFVENSTNKGLHVIIFLDKEFDFTLHNQFQYNNKMFKNFIFNLIGGDYTTLDKVNMGLRTNLRLLYSIHPKTRMQVLPVDYWKPEKTNTKYIDECYVKAKNSIPEIKYKGHWKKINTFEGCKGAPLINLHDLPWNDISYKDGRRLYCKCPWHSDNHASLVVYSKAAFCYVDGRIPFEKIKDYFNL